MSVSESTVISSPGTFAVGHIRTTSLGEIFTRHSESYISQYHPNKKQIEVIKAIRQCKTAALGGKKILCKQCGHEHYIYFSCGHSHCPLCQGIKREQWTDKLRQILYDVPHIHMVFTLPHSMNSLTKRNSSKIYSLLMRTSWMTVKELMREEEHVGGLPGMISVLHTFGSDMKYHVHVHSLVTFGGLTEKDEWIIPKRREKIAPYRKINGLFKMKFMAGIKKLYERGQIDYGYNYSELKSMVGEKQWVVHHTHPTMDIEIVESYLSRYINRIGISASRVTYLKENEEVQVLYNDYKNQKEGEVSPKGIKTMHPLTFIDQFMQHVLPSYFQKSRRYGLYSTRTRREKEKSIPESLKRQGHFIRTTFQILKALMGKEPYSCEVCGSKRYEIVEIRPDRNWINENIRGIKSRSPPTRNGIWTRD